MDRVTGKLTVFLKSHSGLEVLRGQRPDGFLHVGSHSTQSRKSMKCGRLFLKITTS